MEITRHLGVEDRTRVKFPLKVLKKAGLVDQDEYRSFRLPENGVKMAGCLPYVEKKPQHLMDTSLRGMSRILHIRYPPV